MKNYTRKEIDKSGSARYYNEKDQIHRIVGPAVEWEDETKFWWVLKSFLLQSLTNFKNRGKYLTTMICLTNFFFQNRSSYNFSFEGKK